MKPIVIALLMAVTPVSAIAQGTEHELSDLRTHLGLPANTPITLSVEPSIPRLSVYTVYLATGLDQTVETNIEEWVGDWNKKDGKKYGFIQFVRTLSQADLVLARYTVSDQISMASDTSSRVQNRDVKDANGNVVGSMPVAVNNSSSVAVAPVFLYVLRRDRDSFQILFRMASTAPVESSPSQRSHFILGKTGSGRTLVDVLFGILKAQKN